MFSESSGKNRSTSTIVEMAKIYFQLSGEGNLMKITTTLFRYKLCLSKKIDNGKLKTVTKVINPGTTSGNHICQTKNIFYSTIRIIDRFLFKSTPLEINSIMGNM